MNISLAEGERLTETVMETERAGKQKNQSRKKESDIEGIGKKEDERPKETRVRHGDASQKL